MKYCIGGEGKETMKNIAAVDVNSIPKRIAMLSVHTSPLAPLGGKKTGGMNVYVREVAAHLGKRGVKVDVFTREYSPETAGLIQPIAANARLIHLPAGPLEVLDPNAVYPYLHEFRDALIQFVKTNSAPYDLIYSHYWLSGWVAQTLQKTWNVPYVQMFHTLGYMKERIADTVRFDEAEGGILPIYNQRVDVETHIMNTADRLIAATPAERMQMLWLYRANRRHISVVSPGVDIEQFRPLANRVARQKIGLAPKEKMFLFVGRIEPLKAVDTICETLSYLKIHHAEAIEHLRVYVVGGDPLDRSIDNREMLRLQALCDMLGLGDLIQFVGAKDHQLLPYYYSAAEALIVPSDYESFGMVALEAMACGTPVIASQVGGLAFLIEEGKNGFHIPVRDARALADHMLTLLSSPHIRDTMGYSAYQTAQHYSWNAIVDQLLYVFSDVLAQHLPVRVQVG